MKKSYYLGIVLSFMIMFPNILLSYNKKVYDVQFFLQLHGYEPGIADGIIGPSTRKSIIKFKKEQGLVENGEIDETLLKALGLSDHSDTQIPEYPAGKNKNLLVTDKERFRMKLAKTWIGTEDEKGFAKLPGFGQLMTASGWIISAGYATHVSSEKITVKLYNNSEDFYINESTIFCCGEISSDVFDIKFGDTMAVFTKPDSFDAITICNDQFYILINLDNARDVNIDFEKFSCGKVLK